MLQNVHSIEWHKHYLLCRAFLALGGSQAFKGCAVQIIDVGRNSLTGDLSAMDGLQEINQIRIDVNNFTGSIPAIAYRRAEVNGVTKGSPHLGLESHAKSTSSIPAIVQSAELAGPGVHLQRPSIASKLRSAAPVIMPMLL
ncbi:hypothetical protein MMC29_005626 [Sticta canariensis]|nr:hypothetical protein [Sticta canariensis]